MFLMSNVLSACSTYDLVSIPQFLLFYAIVSVDKIISAGMQTSRTVEILLVLRYYMTILRLINAFTILSSVARSITYFGICHEVQRLMLYHSAVFIFNFFFFCSSGNI